MARQLISEENAFIWLSKGDLREAESEITAHDQALKTKCHVTNITNRNR